MKIAILTAATVAALLVSGTTFAASKSTTMNFSFVVASTCEIYLDVDNIEVATFDVVGGNNPENLGVTCSEDLPYIVEASTNAAGQVIAKSTTSAREYPVTFVRGNDTYSGPRFRHRRQRLGALGCRFGRAPINSLRMGIESTQW